MKTRHPFTASELRRFRKYKKHYLEAGYPEHVAEQYAYDHLWAEHNKRIGVWR